MNILLPINNIILTYLLFIRSTTHCSHQSKYNRINKYYKNSMAYMALKSPRYFALAKKPSQPTGKKLPSKKPSSSLNNPKLKKVMKVEKPTLKTSIATTTKRSLANKLNPKQSAKWPAKGKKIRVINKSKSPQSRKVKKPLYQGLRKFIHPLRPPKSYRLQGTLDDLSSNGSSITLNANDYKKMMLYQNLNKDIGSLLISFGKLMGDGNQLPNNFATGNSQGDPNKLSGPMELLIKNKNDLNRLMDKKKVELNLAEFRGYSKYTPPSIFYT